MPSEREKRFAWHSIEAEAFLNESQLGFLKTTFKIEQLRWCSIPDADGNLAHPQKSNQYAVWHGSVQIFLLRNGRGGGCAESLWASLCEFLGVKTARNLEYLRGKNKKIWRAMELYRDSRWSELLVNVMIFKIEKKDHSFRLSKKVLKKYAKQAILESPMSSQTNSPLDSTEDDSKPQYASFFHVEKGQNSASVLGSDQSSQATTHVQIQQDSVMQVNSQKEKNAEKCSKRRKKNKIVPPKHIENVQVEPTEKQLEPVWRTVFVAFLASKDPLNPRRQIAKVIKALLKPVSKLAEFEELISMTSTKGLGALFPLNDDPEHTSTLEWHRRALALEARCALLLRSLAQTSDKPALSENDLEDLRVALQFSGGLSGTGQEYWDAPRGCAQDPGSDLSTLLSKLRSGRRFAFTRTYAVFDECAWGLTYAVDLALLCLQHQNEPTPTQFRNNITQTTKWRTQAAAADAWQLLQYGHLLTTYSARLEHLCDASGISYETAGPGFPEPPRQPVPKPSFIQQRNETELKRLQSVMQVLGVVHSPAIARAKAVQDAIVSAMFRDSLEAAETARLYPSLSLPDAKYDPGSYVQT